jgi:hypothetical protein
MLSIAGAELKAACDYVVANFRAAIPMPLNDLTLKIESFLTIARSLLDVLSSCLAIHQLSDRRVQSFSHLRKRGDCPTWLKEYVKTNLVGSNHTPLSGTRWLFFLMSEKDGGQSLRDFVVHRGVAKYVFRELPFEDGWELIFQPRPNDTYALPVKGVVDKILVGVNDLASKTAQALAVRLF